MFRSLASLIRTTAALSPAALLLFVLAPTLFAQNLDGLPTDSPGTDSPGTDSLGTIVLNMAVDTALVVIDDDFSTYFTITPDDSVVAVPVGNRKLTVATRLYSDYILYSEIRTDTTRVINLHLRFPLTSPESRILNSSWPRLMWESNLAIHTDPGSEIYVEGRHVGGQRAYMNLTPGTYRVRLEDPAGREKRANIIVADNRLTVADLYILPDRRTFFAAAAFPGAGQFYRGDRVIGAVALTSIAGFVTAAYITDRDIRKSTDELEILRNTYREATDERIAWELGNELERFHSNLMGRKRTRNFFIGAAAGLYVAQLIDALRPPRHGFRRPISPAYLVNPTITPEGPGIRLRLDVE